MWWVIPKNGMKRIRKVVDMSTHGLAPSMKVANFTRQTSLELKLSGNGKFGVPTSSEIKIEIYSMIFFRE
jgi:hypothetical protein